MMNSELKTDPSIQVDFPETIKKQDKLGLLKLSVKAAFLSGNRGLGLVERRIKEQLQSEAPQLNEIGNYLLDLGGKRMRPLLTLLSSQLFGLDEPSAELIDAASGIELIHMATLLHDDIIDRSPTRRSQPSAFNRYGIAPTLLTGDYLLVKAFGLCAQLDRFVITETERACVELTEGEILEGTIQEGVSYSFEDYVRVIEKKTACLFSLSAAVGAHLAGASDSDVKKMKAFGRFAGVAFQMIDDILDVTADEDLLGKPAGSDLRQKTPTLINILWLKAEPERARAFFKAEAPSKHDCQEAMEHIRRSSILNEARLQAKDYAGRATNALLSLEDVEINMKVRDQLFSLLEYTLERCL